MVHIKITLPTNLDSLNREQRKTISKPANMNLKQFYVMFLFLYGVVTLMLLKTEKQTLGNTMRRQFQKFDCFDCFDSDKYEI